MGWSPPSRPDPHGNLFPAHCDLRKTAAPVAEETAQSKLHEPGRSIAEAIRPHTPRGFLPFLHAGIPRRAGADALRGAVVDELKYGSAMTRAHHRGADFGRAGGGPQPADFGAGADTDGAGGRDPSGLASLAGLHADGGSGAAALVFLAFVEFQLLHFIFRARRVNTEVLCAGIAGYCCWRALDVGLYAGVEIEPGGCDPSGAFSSTSARRPRIRCRSSRRIISAHYLSTVGYGDISPLSHAARTLAMTEAMTGTLYMAVLISRLVALYSNEKRDEEN